MNKCINLLFLLPVTLWLIVVYYFDFNGLYGQDSHEYLRYSKALSSYFQGGDHPGEYFWPIGFPFIAAVFNTFIPYPIAMQVVSLLSYVGVFIVLFKLFALIDPENKKGNALFVILAFSFCPFIIRSSLLCMSDMLATFFVIGCIYQCIKSIQFLQRKSFLWAFLFASAAFQTRYASIVVLAIPMILMVTKYFKHRRLNYFPLAIIIVLLVAAPHLMIRSTSSFLTSSIHHSESWSIVNLFQSSFSTPEGNSSYQLPNLLYALSYLWHPGYFMIFLPLLLVVFKHKFQLSLTNKMLISSTLLYTIFIAGLPTQNHRFLLLVFPLLLPVFLPFWNFLTNKLLSKSITFAAFALVLCIQSVLFYKSFEKTHALNRLELEVAKELNALPHNRIYGFDIDIALKTYVENKEFRSMWEKQYDTFEQGSLVIFNEQKLAAQWDGKNPMINWGRLNKSYKLKELSTFKQGWKLYEIQ